MTIPGRVTDDTAERNAALSLLSASAVRETARSMLEAGLAGQLPHFTVDIDRLNSLADYVASVICTNHPALDVPLHARWRHFKLNGRDLWAEVSNRPQQPDEIARAAFDLAIVSVLLDAGAGPDWTYRDAATGIATHRSEGLAIASFRMFEAGLFSANPKDPLRADAERLLQLDSADLARGFQVGPDNPLPALEGRAALLGRLGRLALSNPTVFAARDNFRPGGIYDYLAERSERHALAAPDILHALLLHLGPIWPDRLALGGVPLGDTWKHPAIRRGGPADGLVPFHKLSQWLTFSLIEPLRDAGIPVMEIDGLTGLAEYRNGGLFVDGGVALLRDPSQATQPNTVASPLVVEWRALTVALLDRIAPLIRDRLGVSSGAFPLGCILEGGTWAAGRLMAYEKRRDSGPPIHVISDGTVF